MKRWIRFLHVWTHNKDGQRQRHYSLQRARTQRARSKKTRGKKFFSRNARSVLFISATKTSPHTEDIRKFTQINCTSTDRKSHLQWQMKRRSCDLLLQTYLRSQIHPPLQCFSSLFWDRLAWIIHRYSKCTQFLAVPAWYSLLRADDQVRFEEWGDL